MKTIEKSHSNYIGYIQTVKNGEIDTIDIEVNEQVKGCDHIKVSVFQDRWRSFSDMKRFYAEVIKRIEDVEKEYKNE